MSLYLGIPRCRRFQSRFSKAEALEVHRQVSPSGEGGWWRDATTHWPASETWSLCNRAVASSAWFWWFLSTCEAKRPWLGPPLRSISTMTPDGGGEEMGLVPPPLLVPVGPINRHQLLDHSITGESSNSPIVLVEITGQDPSGRESQDDESHVNDLAGRGLRRHGPESFHFQDLNPDGPAPADRGFHIIYVVYINTLLQCFFCNAC